jgi:ribosome-binding protein aMBF1 (putative translation factor)
METCSFCDTEVPGVMKISVFTHQGILVCPQCYELILASRHKPYSRVMEKLAMLEAGYHVNRKRARMKS